MEEDGKEYKFLGFVENYSYCWHKTGEKLISPEFTAEDLHRTVWTLQLYPRGNKEEARGNITLYLNRNVIDDGPEELSLNCNLAILATDGSANRPNNSKCIFKRGTGNGYQKFIRIDELYLKENADYLPSDTLTVRCKIWSDGEDVYKAPPICARTRIGTEKISFLHTVRNFSTFEPSQSRTVYAQSRIKKGCVVSSNLHLTDGSCCDGKIVVEVRPPANSYVLLKRNTFLLSASGNLIGCCDADTRKDCTRKDIQKLPLSLTKDAILNSESDYLLDDGLHLLCDCSFSTGIEFGEIEETRRYVPRSPTKETGNSVHCTAGNTTEDASGALDDFRAAYCEQFLTDVELKTKTNSFPAHKVVLCARSPVFKAMLTMREKATDCIQVDDLEDDVVHHLLLFLYSDKLEDLQWNAATKLYYSADKYQIEKLKLACFSFLTDNLSASNASELLLLADIHGDRALKNTVEEFILRHEAKVFCSDAWKKLMETNPVLCLKTMHLKYAREEEVNASNF